MKISFRPKIHNCDKHLTIKEFHKDYYINEYIVYCSICKKIKEHNTYGDYINIKWKKRLDDQDW